MEVMGIQKLEATRYRVRTGKGTVMGVKIKGDGSMEMSECQDGR